MLLMKHRDIETENKSWLETTSNILKSLTLFLDFGSSLYWDSYLCNAYDWENNKERSQCKTALHKANLCDIKIIAC